MSSSTAFEVTVHQDPTDKRPKANEHDIETKADASVAIIGLVTFVGDCARGILFPVLWPLCQSLHGNKVDYGFLVSIFSVGRLVITSRMGILSDKYRHRTALVFAGIIFSLGAALWGNVQFIGPLAVLYIAQFVLGLGTGSLGVTRSYIVEQVAPAKRTYMLARLSALQYAGFAATPLLGSALVVAGSSISKTMEFALPGYLVLILSLICLGLLYFVFQDIQEMYVHEPEQDVLLETSNNPLNRVEEGASASSSSDDLVSTSTPQDDTATTYNPIVVPQVNTDVEAPGTAPVPPAPVSPVAGENAVLRNRVFLLMMFLNFTTRGGIAVYETQGSQILLDQYHMPQWKLGLLVSMAGVIGTVQLVFFKQFWCERFTDTQLMLGGLTLFAVAQLFVINWGPDRPIPEWQYVLSMYLVYAFAYPISNSAVLGVFSSLQKAGKQATAQGHFALMGSLARVLMPIVTGFLEANVEYSSSFALVLILMSASIAGAVLLDREIVFFSSPVLSSTAVFDAKAAHNKMTTPGLVTVGFCGLATFVALMTMADWGVSSW